MSRDARVEGDVLVQKIRLTKFCFEALKFEHYTNVKTSFCFSMVHTGLQARFQKNESQIRKPKSKDSKRYYIVCIVRQMAHTTRTIAYDGPYDMDHVVGSIRRIGP